MGKGWLLGLAGLVFVAGCSSGDNSSNGGVPDCSGQTAGMCPKDHPARLVYVVPSPPAVQGSYALSCCESVDAVGSSGTNCIEIDDGGVVGVDPSCHY